MRVHHREKDAVFHLHIPVANARGAAEFGPSDLHPDEVIRIVDHAHLVGFGIPHAEARLVKGHAENFTVPFPRGPDSGNRSTVGTVC